MNFIFKEMKIETIRRREILQLQLLTPSKFSIYCKDLGLSTYFETSIIPLWHIGLLHADMVVADKKLKIEGIDLVGRENGQYVYADNRSVVVKESWAGCFTEVPEYVEGIKLWFHPYRYYVINIIEQVFDYHLSPYQYLIYEDGIKNCCEKINSYRKSLETRKIYSDRVSEANNIATMCVFAEPFSHQKIFNSITYRPPETLDNVKIKIDIRSSLLKEKFEQIGINELEKIRGSICEASEILDPNKRLHMMLRLMNKDMRHKLKGRLGGSMLLFSMAESIRRAAENVFSIELLEEDELGFGVWFSGAREEFYGSKRLYDAEDSVKQTFFRQFGADYGQRVRCYVEGDTEFFALSDFISDKSNKIEIINLKGQVVEKGGKGVAFRESLKADIKKRVFSVVIIDDDNQDYVRVVKKACEDDQICGQVIYQKPDFEFGNFTIDELITMVWDYVQKNTLEVTLEDIKNKVKTAENGKTFEKMVKTITNLQNFGKGDEWGKLLMKYAWENQKFPNRHFLTGERPIVVAAKLLIQLTHCDYALSRSGYKIDKESGAMVKRDSD